MKIHGNIEAQYRYFSRGLEGQDLYPWMKIHGNIEAALIVPEVVAKLGYPWMKIHGNIEA